MVYNICIVYIYKDEEFISLFKHTQDFVCKQFRIIFYLMYYKQKIKQEEKYNVRLKKRSNTGKQCHNKIGGKLTSKKTF